MSYPFSIWLRSKMESKNFNASSLARALNIKPSAVSHWLNNKRLPDPESKQSLPEILGVSLEEVLLITHKAELRRLK